MSFSLSLFITLHVLAFVFFVATLRRVFLRAHEFPMQETSFTLPLGFVRLRHLVTLYVLFYFLWVGFSLWLYFTMIAPPEVLSSPVLPQGNRY